MSIRKDLVTIQIGCRSEWHALDRALEHLGGIAPLHLGPFSQYHGITISDVNFILFQGGPSKSVAAASCQHALSTYDPSLHIMMGTCGGVSGRPGLGELLYASRAAQYDCIDRLCESNGFFYKPFDVHIDNHWIRDVLTELRLTEGMVATADQDIDYSLRMTLKNQGADVADWETAASALVCHRNRVPILVLRGVSDLPEADLSRADQAKSFTDKTPEIMAALANLLPEIAAHYKTAPPKSNTKILPF